MSCIHQKSKEMAGVRPFVRIFINDKSMDSYRVVLHHIRIAISLFVEEKRIPFFSVKVIIIVEIILCAIIVVFHVQKNFRL